MLLDFGKNASLSYNRYPIRNNALENKKASWETDKYVSVDAETGHLINRNRWFRWFRWNGIETLWMYWFCYFILRSPVLYAQLKLPMCLQSSSFLLFADSLLLTTLRKDRSGWGAQHDGISCPAKFDLIMTGQNEPKLQKSQLSPWASLNTPQVIQ